MKFYNFEVRTLDQNCSEQCLPFPNDQAARTYAAKLVGDLLRSHAKLPWQDQLWRMDVVDEQGRTLWIMSLAMSEPADETD